MSTPEVVPPTPAVPPKQDEDSGTLVGAAFLLVMCVAAPLSGLITLVWQIYRYLRDGFWTSVSVIDAMLRVGIETPWMRNPTEWIGVWKILDRTSWSFASVLVMLIGFWFWSRD